MYVAARSYLATGVAVVGASALAISTLSPVSTPLSDVTVPAISTAAVDLTSLAKPLELWVQVLSEAVDNAGALGQNWLSDPAPILRQLAANQIGYIETLAADVVTAMFSLTTALPLLTGVLGPIINPINALGARPRMSSTPSMPGTCLPRSPPW